MSAELAAQFTPLFQDRVREYGLPTDLAKQLSLHWNADLGDFTVDGATDEVAFYEYGDGKTPPRAPLRKALNRLRRDLAPAQQRQADEENDRIAQGAQF